ncbi:MAG: transposase [Thiotrichaceae bacterium]|nr:transposase [Thiotrichaceae bacterium]
MPLISVVVLKPWRTVLNNRKSPVKKTFHYEERDEVKRQAYLSRHNELDASKIVYVDESGIEEAEKKGKRSRRVNIIAGLVNNRLIAPCVFNGYVNADCFKDRSLLLIMPVSISQLRLEKAQCRLVFLPAYSPDLNPIENCWAIIKARLKKLGSNLTILIISSQSIF